MNITKLDDLKIWRQYLHKNPELSQKEFKTASFIRSQLDIMGVEYETPLPTASIVHIKGNSNRYIILRADIDALPICEKNEIEYASQNKGIMHACGHDAHVAMLLGAVKELKYLSDLNKLNINILAVFQQSEESFGGADKLIKAFNFENFDIDSAYALHVNPDFEEGNIISRVGPIMASCQEFAIEIKGKSAHVGIREAGINAMNAAVSLYSQVQAIPTYNLDCKHTNIIHIGYMKVGEVMNSVPENGYLEGTIRTYDINDKDIIMKRITDICRGVEISTSCKLKAIFRDGYPALINSEELIDRVKHCAENTSAIFSLKKDPYLLGEDFSFFSKICPINYSFIGIRNEKLGYTSGLHTSNLMMREEALTYGVDYFVEIVKSF